MKFSKLVNIFRNYLNVPNINLKTFKEILAIILDCCSPKEKIKFSKMILERFSLEGFNKVQLSLNKSLELISNKEIDDLKLRYKPKESEINEFIELFGKNNEREI